MSDRPGNMAQQVEAPDDFATPAARWFAEFDQARLDCYDWWRVCDMIERIYRGGKQAFQNREVAFNILWSNIETLKPAIYARPPVAVVARKYADRDPVGRAASMILRRCIEQTAEAGKLDRKLKQVRDDYLLYGRGVLWARYEAETSETGQITEDSEEQGERVEEEEICWDFVRRRDFLHSSSPNWESVTWVAREVRMTMEDGVERFGPQFRDVPLEWMPDRQKNAQRPEEAHSIFARARVFEVWDITTRKVHWLAQGYDKILDIRDDPLGLRDFFPTPRPLYATLTDSSLIPVPDYQEYGPQAEQLNELTERIRNVTKAIKVAGVYNSQFTEIANLLNDTGENQLVAVTDWMEFAEKQGLKGSIDFLPILDMVQTLESLLNARGQVKSDLYEITGISDVIRGAETTSGDKTATEIKTKGKYATLRLSDRQAQMAEYVTDCLRITGEIVAEHFGPETLREMSCWDQSELAQDERDSMMGHNGGPPMGGPDMGMPPDFADQARRPPAGDMGRAISPPGTAQNLNLPQVIAPQPQSIAPLPLPMFDQAVALLRNNRLRDFRIEIEDKSTIQADEMEQKEARVEFLSAVGAFIEKALMIPPAMAPIMIPALGKMLLFGVRGFPIGLELETMLEDTITRLTKHAEMMAQQPPPPDPDVIKAQAAVAKSQSDMQIKQAESQAAMQVEQMRMQAMQMKTQSDMQIAQVQLQIKQIEAQIAGVQLQHEAAQSEAQNAQDMTEHVLKAQEADIEAGDADLRYRAQTHQEMVDAADLALRNRELDIKEKVADKPAPARA